MQNERSKEKQFKVIQELSGCVPFILTSWIVGCLFRVSFTLLIFISSSLIDLSPKVDRIFQDISSILMFEFNYFWLPKSSGDLVNFKYPYLVIVLPFFAAALSTLLLGIIITLTLRNLRSLIQSK